MSEGEYSGMNAVVIGGGSGSPVSIKSLLSLGFNTTAVVAMADDGGSTGLLREKADVTPPGDIRKCLVAMAADQADPMTKAFKTRFQFSDNHALGNLMLVALEETAGSFPEAIDICARLLDARGAVHPSTLTHVRLNATTRDGQTLEGQALACHSKTALDRIWLSADEPIEAYEPALKAIRNADLIVLGPGSLYTSIAVNLLVPGILDAIKCSGAPTVFVCSVADVQGETWGLTLKEHLKALIDHGLSDSVDYVLVHALADDKPHMGMRTVAFDQSDLDFAHDSGTVVLIRDLADAQAPTHHSLTALEAVLEEVLSLCRSRRK